MSYKSTQTETSMLSNNAVMRHKNVLCLDLNFSVIISACPYDHDLFGILFLFIRTLYVCGLGITLICFSIFSVILSLMGGIRVLAFGLKLLFLLCVAGLIISILKEGLCSVSFCSL